MTAESLRSRDNNSRKKEKLSFSIDNILGKPFSGAARDFVSREQDYWAPIKPALRIPQPNFGERTVKVYHINTDQDRHSEDMPGTERLEVDIDDEEDIDRCPTIEKEVDEPNSKVAAKYENNNSSRNVFRREKYEAYDDEDDDGVNSSDDIDVTFAVDDDNDKDNVDCGPASNDEEAAPQSSRVRNLVEDVPPRGQLRLSMPNPHSLIKMNMGNSADSSGSSPNASRGVGHSRSMSPKALTCRNARLDSNTSFSSSFSSSSSVAGRNMGYHSGVVPPFWASAAGTDLKYLDMPRPTGLG